MEVVPHYKAFGFQCWEVLGCLILDVECCGSVASHFRPSLGTLTWGSLILLEGFYRAHASLKTSPPQGVSPVRKRAQALENFQNRKEK
jgi:hypothetical protein